MKKELVVETQELPVGFASDCPVCGCENLAPWGENGKVKCSCKVGACPHYAGVYENDTTLEAIYREKGKRNGKRN